MPRDINEESHVGTHRQGLAAGADDSPSTEDIDTSGVSKADLVKVHGVTATAAELNKLAGAGAKVPSGTVVEAIGTSVNTIATNQTSVMGAAINHIYSVLSNFGMVSTHT